MSLRTRFKKVVFAALGLGLLQGCPSAPPVPPPPSEQPAPLPQPTMPEIPAMPEPPPAPAPPRFEEQLPESRLRPPQKDRVSLDLKYDSRLFRRMLSIANHPGWQYRSNQQNQIVGFDFSNRGANRIVPHRYDSGKNQFFGRDFQFRFDEWARQDIHLMISDWAPSRDRQFRLSELMNSVMVFFPRNLLPAIEHSELRTLVTLPTGEAVEFDAATNEIKGGVFAEEPLDLNTDRSARRFPAVNYTGKGVVVRADARGSDPRLSSLASITTGAPPTDCANKGNCNQCKVSTKDLWHGSGAVRFKFATDQEFDRFLQLRCGFGLSREEIRN